MASQCSRRAILAPLRATRFHPAENPASIAPMTTLIVFGGLPGAGKTAIAQELACELRAVYLRIDSLEQAIRASGILDKPLEDEGYRIAYALAEENLRRGRTVVADCVNPLQITRDAWVSVADRSRSSSPATRALTGS